ncbi:TonB-dependent receptor domain-containing protein [Candidatus Acidulodesulfobacterium sp. H_13]|uniref:TonB-dependent receptor plug domain-containing protein n=1 Tax=Candidatus Acidulodesulfobacterium sp. H_13 TaxID=3395470 RepID=UPI003AF54E49
MFSHLFLNSLSAGMLLFLFGLRHVFDIGNIAAIDDSIRRPVNDGKETGSRRIASSVRYAFTVLFLSIIAASALYYVFGFNSVAFAGENIVITASRIKSNIISTPSYTQVITQKDIKNQGSLFAQDSLNDLSGVSVISYGPFGGGTSFDMLGLSSYYTKYLMDGVNIGDPSLTQVYYNFAYLTPSSINRIEVVQGTQSGLYGANAIAGVVNIITKKGENKPHIEYAQTYGSFGTFRENLTYSGKVNSFSFYLNGLRFDTAGTPKTNAYNPKTKTYSYGDAASDAFHETALNTRLEYDGADFEVGTVLNFQKIQNYLDQYDPDLFVPNNSSWLNRTYPGKNYREDEKSYFTKIYAEKDFGNLHLSMDAYDVTYLRRYIDIYSNPYPPITPPAPQSLFYNDKFNGYRYGSDIKADYRFNKNLKTVVGMNYIVDKMSQDKPSFFSASRDNTGGFLEVLPRFGNMNLQASFREDHFQTFGNHFTYKLGASYFFSPTNTILKVNYGTGFLAPSLFELYSSPVAAWYFLGGNVNLSPEHSKSWSLGFMQNFLNNKLSFRSNLFKTLITNRIEWHTNPLTYKSTYENVNGNTKVAGIEVNAVFKPIKSLRVALNYTYIHSKNPKTGMQNARIPYDTLTGSVDYSPIKKLTLYLGGRYVGTRYNYNYKHQTGRYAVFNANAAYRFTKNLEVSLAVRNIFNRFYQDIYGYTTPERSVYATIRYKF